MSLPRNYKRVLASLAEIIDRNVTELIRLLEDRSMESGSRIGLWPRSGKN